MNNLKCTRAARLVVLTIVMVAIPFCLRAQNRDPATPRRVTSKTVPAGVTATPLTPGEKFKMFALNASSPMSFLSAGISSGLSQASNDYPSWGQGGEGYGKRFGAAMADQASGEFFSRFVYPTMFHQDPRYYRSGEGSVGRRVGHVLGSALMTRSDDGSRAVNFSNILGNLSSGALSNTYYPDEDRGAALTFTRAGWGAVGGMANHLAAEFWPDVKRKMFGKK